MAVAGAGSCGGVGPGAFTSTGAILVLFILLVIISLTMLGGAY
ncbi:YjcZ family sporulation protein [Paenibacillus pinistramenti]|nr:YjcZ family sporulation protein [Paenibacillus pinistramenti]